MDEAYSASESNYRCFRCQSGCVHLVCGNAIIRLTPEQFLLFADSVNTIRRQILDEGEAVDVFANASTVVM